MYAVIQTGGKQYRVAKDDVIKVEKLAGEAGATIELDQVLMLGNGADTTVGAPLVDGARVVATVLEQTRGAKILVFKKKRRKKYRRTRGHRQDLTVLRITEVLAAGAKAAKAPAEAKPEAEAKPPAEAKPKAEAKAPEAKTPEAKTPEAKTPEAKTPEAKTEDAGGVKAPAKKAPAKKTTAKKTTAKKPAAKKAPAKKAPAKKTTGEES